MIYASLTNRHLDTMVISAAKEKKKKKFVFPLLSDLWFLWGMCIFAYARTMWIGKGRDMVFLKSLVLTWIMISMEIQNSLSQPHFHPY